MFKIFVSSPLRGDIENNIIVAQKICRIIAQNGMIPIAPHIYFTSFLDDCVKKERRLGMRMGMRLLPCCDQAWFCTFDGKSMSEGMQEELAVAKVIKKPIRHFDSIYWIEVEAKEIGKVLKSF
jgi:hypothetical protein